MGSYLWQKPHLQNAEHEESLQPCPQWSPLILKTHWYTAQAISLSFLQSGKSAQEVFCLPIYFFSPLYGTKTLTVNYRVSQNHSNWRQLPVKKYPFATAVAQYIQMLLRNTNLQKLWFYKQAVTSERLKKIQKFPAVSTKYSKLLSVWIRGLYILNFCSQLEEQRKIKAILSSEIKA